MHSGSSVHTPLSADRRQGENTAPRKIGVAFLIHSVSFGGPDAIVLNWLKTIDRGRFQPLLIAFETPHGEEKSFVEAARRAGMDLEFVPWHRGKPLWRTARATARLVRKHDIAVLHCFNYYADLVGVLVKWMTGVKIVTTMWMWGNLGWKRAILQAVERLALYFFDQVTAQSEDARRDTVQPFLPAGKIQLLICGYSEAPVILSPAERARRRMEMGVDPNDVVLIHVARFWPEKAHDVLIEGLDRIRRQRDNVKLLLAGVGPLQEDIRALVTSRGLDPWVRFLGFRPDLPEVHATADIQVHPSRREGLPLAVCSGMAAGMPIVASNVGGISEVILPEKTGLLVEPENAEQFALTVIRLIDDPALRQRLGSQARTFLREEYSLEIATARLEKLYEEVLAR